MPDYTRASMAMGYEFGVTPLQLAAAYARDRQRRRAADADAGARGARPRGPGALPAPAGAGAPGHLARGRGAAAGVPARARSRKAAAPATRRGWPTTSWRARPARPGGSWAGVRRQGLSRVVRGVLPGGGPAARGRREDRRPDQGVVLRRADGGAGHQRMLEQALASRYSAIDRARLGGTTAAVAAQLPAPAPQADAVASVTRVAWPYRKPDTTAAKAVATVPDVSGRGVRAAVLALHQRGFRVSVKGTGAVVRTRARGREPRAGAGTRGDHLDRGVTVRTQCAARRAAPRRTCCVEADALPDVSGHRHRQPQRRARDRSTSRCAARRPTGTASSPTRSARGAAALVVESRQPVAAAAGRGARRPPRRARARARLVRRSRRRDCSSIGVTGTNGKTTTTGAGPPPASTPTGTAGSIGTLGAFDGAGRRGALDRRLAHHAGPGRPAGDLRRAARRAACATWRWRPRRTASTRGGSTG